MSPRTERELLDAIVDLAAHTRWAVHHDRPARRGGAGWATVIQGDAGFPDICIARRGVVLFRELKGYDRNGRVGRLSSEQRDWARQLSGLDTPLNEQPPFPDVRRSLLWDVWIPDDWDELIVPTLTAKATVHA